jgi:hypothetical protein
MYEKKVWLLSLKNGGENQHFSLFLITIAKMLNLSLLTQTLPEDLIKYIKDFTLSPNIRLQLFYEKHKFNESKLKNLLNKFSSQQLELINWKYLYFKIYKTSPPGYDNENLVPIFNKVPVIRYSSVFEDIYSSNILGNETSKLNDPIGSLWNYRLTIITRSDYYEENAKTEESKKRQQCKNIINSWKNINKGQGSSKIPEIDDYFQNLEFELIKTLVLLP